MLSYQLGVSIIITTLLQNTPSSSSPSPSQNPNPPKLFPPFSQSNPSLTSKSSKQEQSSSNRRETRNRHTDQYNEIKPYIVRKTSRPQLFKKNRIVSVTNGKKYANRSEESLAYSHRLARSSRSVVVCINTYLYTSMGCPQLHRLWKEIDAARHRIWNPGQVR